MATTTKPTGLTLSRNGNNFTLSWKKGDNNYDAGQNFEWRTNNDAKFIANSIAKRDTSKVKQLSESDYYPNTELLLEWIEMRVRGKRAKYRKKGKTIKPTMSAWATKRLDLAPPKKPQLTATMHESQWNVCTFAWEVETSDTDIYWFNDVEWETILVRESDVTNGADLAWETDETYQSGTGTKTDNQVITEDSFDISDGSYTRWFRVRSRGPAGASGWEYQNHVYGLSYQAIIESAVATVQPAGGFQCRVVWEAPANPSHPIDKTTVEYSITVPDEDLACPDDASWTSANVSADTENKDAVVFPIDRLLSNDQCLFVRVNTEHDGVNTYGVPRLVDGGVGALSNPTLNSVTLGDNYMVTINATNASTVEDSYLVILYRPASDPTGEIVLGNIPHGQTSKSVQAPDWSGETAYAFGVYAAVGDSTTISHDGALMKSSIVWGTGNVPKAPENVRVSATNISGTIRVEWNWTWTEADGAELSWADHEDAWESTDGPETYELSNIRNSRWNISGLETGVKWYVKVRLKKGTGENETYGPYSETKIIDLTSAPSIPTLVLSEPVITETGSVIASWVYTTTDGTAQTYAEICEAELTTEGIEYGDIIAHTETAQHVTINAEDAGWQTGETYYLCVRVVSASGRVSDDWSAPVPIAIAEPLEVNITETSLVEEADETNPRTFSGNPISFETEIEESFAKLETDINPTQSGTGTPSPSNVRPIYGVGGVEVDVVGKNLCGISSSASATYTSNGITWTKVDNGTIHVQGTATAQSICALTSDWSKLAHAYLPSGTYRASTDADVNLRIGVGVSNTNKGNAKGGFSVTLDTDSDVWIGLFVPSGTTINKDIHIQLELGTTATDYVPYTEPITVTQNFNVSLTPTSKDTDPYLFKVVGDIYGDRLEEELVGGSVVWNQLLYNGKGDSIQNWNGIRCSLATDGTAITATTDGTGFWSCMRTIVESPINHKYIVAFDLKASSTGLKISGSLSGNSINNNTFMANKSVGSANTWERIAIITNATTENVTTFRLGVQQATSGNTISIKNVNVVDLTAMFSSTIADYAYTLEQGTAGSGIAWLKSYGFFTKPYYEYDAGTLKSVNPTAHVTTGKNLLKLVNMSSGSTGVTVTTTDEPKVTFNGTRSGSATVQNIVTNWSLPTGNYILSGGQNGDTIGIQIYNTTTGNTFRDTSGNGISFSVNEGDNLTVRTYIGANATANNMVRYPMIRLASVSDSTYLPYEEHAYDLGDVTLRGVPKLVNNELVYDGDIYEHDGAVTRKYGIVDLGTLNWTANGESGGIYEYAVTLTGKAYGTTNMICEPPLLVDNDNTVVNKIRGRSASAVISATTSIATASAFKSAMSGVMLCYEKNTTTTEQTDPFTEIQNVSKYGTLEYITNNDVPVGHNTTYMTRDVFGGTLDLVSGRLVVTHIAKDIGSMDFENYKTGGFRTVGSLNPLPISATGAIDDPILIVSMYRTYPASATLQSGQASIAGNSLYLVNADYPTDVSAFKQAMNGQLAVYKIATPLTYQLTPKQIQTLVGTNNVWGDDTLDVRIAEDAKSIYALKEMPLTLTVDKGDITAVIERAISYHIDRPNETAFDGFEGETIAIKKGNVESFDIEDLIGSLDDGASYRLIVTVKDELGQSAEDSIDFEVHWTHQALVPEGQVVIDSEEYIAKITPQAPQGAVSTDRCDIYRLSADRPELIIKDGIFGETYVDPYPAIGQFGGYRLVFRTANGDYITEDNEIAWLDIDESLGIEYTIIDFDGGQIFLQYNVDVSNTWAKDFQETKYLGGSVQGDWNPAVSRTSSISAVTITITDEDQIEMIHRLAVNPSLCHVRTTGGASFSADVQVTENYTHEKRGKIASYTFAITRVDTEHLDGMTLAQWEDLQEEDELE